MDFDLKVGDTFTLDSPFLNPRTENLITTNDEIIVDSVYIKNDRKHIFFKELSSSLIGLPNKFYFIEGVGTTLGLGFNFSFVYHNRDYAYPSLLLCNYKNNERSFVNTFFSTNAFLSGINSFNTNICVGQGKYFSTSINNDEIYNTLKVYPNPAKKQINFKLPAQFTSDKYTLSFWNDKGQLVQMEDISNHRFTLYRKGLKRGLYFYRLTNNQGEQLKSGKLIFAD